VKHVCHARGCHTAIKPELLMCGAHWRAVPLKIQRAVWATYRPGQCNDKRPSGGWHEAASAAIGFVARREGHPLTVAEMIALRTYGFAGTKAEKELEKLGR
jgi:hypothetical protein